MSVVIDKSRNKNLSEQSLQLLTKYYCKENECPQGAFKRASEAFCGGDMDLAQRIYDYVSKGWFMFSSPILSNAPSSSETSKSMPISCYLTYTPDTREGLIDHTVELRWLSMMGGGVGGHWSDVRSLSKKAPGPIPFLKTVDADMTAYRQGVTRKGSYAAYMDVSHPDIIEFIKMRKPTGDLNRKCLNLHNAVNITDDFMRAVECGSDWDLIDPHDKTVRDTMKARKIWSIILETRLQTGEPYLNFIDTAYNQMPQSQKDLGLTLQGSNLCNEIHLFTDSKRTAVCCLSSINVEKWEDWRNTSIIEDLVEFLDNVLQYFIDNAPSVLSKAVYSASRERAIGLGAMGLHYLFQSKMLPFDSPAARALSNEVFKTIRERANAKSLKLGKLRGEPDDMKGTGERFSHKLAIAPNANSALILDTSASIEPLPANCFASKTRVGTHEKRSKYLEVYLESIGKNTPSVWSSITVNNGSVQHLDFIPEDVKDVFKTAMEIDQIALIDMAGDRQRYLCQGQSLNIFVHAKPSKKYLHELHYRGWKAGLKGMYYLRTTKDSSIEVASKKIERKSLSSDTEIDDDECMACEG